MPGIIRCPSCGQEIDSNSRFCVHCTARICPGCHGPVPPKAVFCPHCGFAVGPAVPGAAEQQPTPPPPPRSFPTSQGGILGPQPGQQPSYPQAPSPPTTGAASGTPIPQPMPPQQYGTGDQPPVASGSPGAMPYASAQQPPVSTKKTFVDTGPIRVRRFPTVLVVILIIAVIVLPGFAAFKAGWLEAPLNSVQEFISGIDLPQWLPIGSKDTTPPVISGVNVSGITQTGAVITWQTDEPSTSQVMICDLGGGCTWTELDENLITNHSVNLRDLKPNIDYHLTATSTDDKGNQAIDEIDFTTLAEAAVATLTISGIQISNITDLNATISWMTDKPATTQVEYGTTNAYGSTTALDDRLATSHSASLAGLKPITIYHFKVKSKDASGEEVASQDQTFTTRSIVSAATEIGPEVGKLAPDFTLPTMDDKEIRLNDFRGKIVMINFWQDIQQSRNELSVIQEVYDKWPDDNLAILAISWKQTPSVTQNVASTKGLTLPILLDETGEVAAKYNVLRSPATFFIDTQGVIRDIKGYPATLKSIEQVESILNSMQ
ncbi:MAG: redoxin domain-containing protein [Dehalococcoidia bacterium]|nr:redoxin domain-containing protein [Dehalococcoidia bacterium]